MTTCDYREVGRRCIRRADHEPHGHITAPWKSPDPVCGQCDSRCPGDPAEHEPLPGGWVGKCNGCSCPQYQTERDE